MAKAKRVAVDSIEVEEDVEQTEVTPDIDVADARLIAMLKAQGVSMGEALAAAITKSKGKEKVSYGDYIRRPEQVATRRKLKRPAFQNGYAVNPSGLSEHTLNKLAELETGKYMGGIVEVFAKDHGGPIYLKYKNASPDDRMSLAAHWTSFSDLVTKLHAEMKSRTIKA